MLNLPRMTAVVAVAGTVLTLMPGAQALAPRDRQAETRQDELVSFLKDFYKDSNEAMNRIPPKYDESGNRVDEKESIFSLSEIESGSYIQARDEKRKRLMVTKKNPTMAFQIRDRVESLVEVPKILRTLGEMEQLQLTQQTLDRLPWSDSYWPLNKGMTAARYADPQFPDSANWQRNLSYVQSNPPSEMIRQGRGHQLAPSEKYDLLVGDLDETLTRKTWATIQAIGRMEGWAGICDGWAASSVMYPEPVKAVDLITAHNQPVRFYPSDIKALAALIWAKGIFSTNFIGSRCAISNPARDEMGRVIAPQCQDNNAGTWHMSVVNQLGLGKRALLIDATYDYQIWNFPVWKYQYSYFNPQTQRPTNNWWDATVPVESFTLDRFKRYRAAGTRFVTGVSMSVTYMIETKASHRQGSISASRTVNYVYDLELDPNMEIIGGEWYSNIHPDFIWTPKVGTIARSVGDAQLTNPQAWESGSPLPFQWMIPSRSASSRLQPLGAIVEKLIEFSKTGP